MKEVHNIKAGDILICLNEKDKYFMQTGFVLEISDGLHKEEDDDTIILQYGDGHIVKYIKYTIKRKFKKLLSEYV